MEFRPSHIGICVTHLSRSIAFYTALGFTKAEGFEQRGGSQIPPADGTTSISTLLEIEGVHLFGQFMRRADGLAIELLEFKNPHPFGQYSRRSMNQLGFTHLSYYVTDLEAAMAVIEKAGGTAHRHTRNYFDTPGMNAVFCSDPDGVRIELMQLTSAQ